TLDEAGQRISRFLVVQSAINGAFGAVGTLGLLGIGVAYAPLWGGMAAVLRFVPFVGAFLALVLPAGAGFVEGAGRWGVGAGGARGWGCWGGPTPWRRTPSSRWPSGARPACRRWR